MQRKGVKGGGWDQGCRASESDEKVAYRLLTSRIGFVYSISRGGEDRCHPTPSRNGDVDVFVVGQTCGMFMLNEWRYEVTFPLILATSSTRAVWGGMICARIALKKTVIIVVGDLNFTARSERRISKCLRARSCLNTG